VDVGAFFNLRQAVPINKSDSKSITRHLPLASIPLLIGRFSSVYDLMYVLDDE
jgi:hypothetical protein